jgi:hypothetical protein
MKTLMISLICLIVITKDDDQQFSFYFQAFSQIGFIYLQI